MNKCELRDMVKSRLNDFDDGFFASADEMIFQNLLTVKEFLAADKVCLYSSMKKEAGTGKIVEYCQNAGKKVYLPTVCGEQLKCYLIDENTRFITNKWGICEPFPDKNYLTDFSDMLFVVPLLGFSENFERLGRGKGFYDRFLDGKKGNFLALAYDLQQVESGFLEKHDISLDIIVTNTRILRKNK